MNADPVPAFDFGSDPVPSVTKSDFDLNPVLDLASQNCTGQIGYAYVFGNNTASKVTGTLVKDEADATL
jgi:hypothetical protein